MNRPVILVLALLAIAQQAVGQGLISTWLKNVGIKYIPPNPRQGTCRDCTSGAGRFGFDITPTQPTGPCCTTTTAAPTVAPGLFKCGVEGTSRIVGGVASTAGKYPWIGAYLNSGQNPGGCAGTLVAAEWVVTAAHCLDGVTKDNLKIILGEYDLSSATDSADTNRKEVSLAIDPIVHENYNSPYQSSNDIALLKLAEAVDLNVHTPACLPALNTDYTGKTGSVYGWGTTNSCPNSGIEQIMREVEVPIVSDTTCAAASGAAVTFSDGAGSCTTQALNYNGKISEDMVCAGAQGKDACQGDSGGPFTVKSVANQHELVGVVSWGYGCAADGLYGVYSEVAKLRTWIDTKIAANGGATFTP